MEAQESFVHRRGTGVHRSGRTWARRDGRRRDGVSLGVCLETLESRAMLAFDPTPAEQYLLELTNRFRLDPQRELSLLTTSLGNPARSADSDVDSALRFFRTSGTVLQEQWQSLRAAQPLAWNEALYDAAEFHSNAMIEADEQEHQLPGEPGLGTRISDAGYSGWSTAGESIFAFARSVLHTHAGFLLDWGNTPTGIQDPPGHRESAINPQFREVGIRILNPGERVGKQTGPLVVTQDFGRRFTQTQAFLLGAVYGDGNDDGFYSQGEGLGGVRVQVSASGSSTTLFETTTMTAGGWQLSLPSGTYNVTFSGAGFGTAVTYRDVLVGTENVKLDAVRGERPPAPGFRLNGSNNATIGSGDTTPSVGDGTDFGGANVSGQFVERTFAVTNTGNLALQILAGGPGGVSGNRVLITGAGASDFTVVRDLPETIGPGQLATFVIRFDPTATGLRGASVTLATSASGAESVSFAISGRGATRPVVEIRGNGVAIPRGDITPRMLDGSGFGTVVTPGGSRVRTFEVWNLGSANLNVRSVTIVNADAGFQVIDAGLGRITPGGSREISVRYRGTTASAAGVKTAELVVVTNDPVAREYRFTLRANVVVSGRLSVRSGGGLIAPGEPGSVQATSFGEAPVDGAIVERAFTIRNTGLATLRLTGAERVEIVGADAGAFALARGPARTVLGVGESTVFRVRFDPSMAGEQTARVRIASNDRLLGMIEFEVFGVGV